MKSVAKITPLVAAKPDLRHCGVLRLIVQAIKCLGEFVCVTTLKMYDNGDTMRHYYIELSTI